MAIITTMTTPRSSLRSALLSNDEAVAADLCGQNIVVAPLGSESTFGLPGSDARLDGTKRGLAPSSAPRHGAEEYAGGKRFAQRRHQTSRFFPLSHLEQVF